MSSADLAGLKVLLERYFAAVQAQKSENPPDLLPLFKELDSWEKDHAAGLDPRLRHFLENKSYRKAHSYLLGTPAGELGH